HVLLPAHVQAAQSAGLVGVREGPLYELATPPQQLLASIATDPLPVRVDCRLLLPLARPFLASAIGFGDVGPYLELPRRDQRVPGVVALIRHQLFHTFRGHLELAIRCWLRD